jgi:hypothetical protein
MGYIGSVCSAELSFSPPCVLGRLVFENLFLLLYLWWFAEEEYEWVFRG